MIVAEEHVKFIMNAEKERAQLGNIMDASF